MPNKSPVHAIIPFVEAHIPTALELWSKSEHVGFGDSDEPSKLKRYIKRNVGYSFVAIHQNELIGTILAGHDERRGYIYHLATSVSNRRTGVASDLLDRSLSALRGYGILKCHAFVFRTNPHAELFWSKLGWQQRDDLYVYSKITSENST